MEICPDLFYMHLDGLAYVKDMGSTGYGPDGKPLLAMAQGLAVVPDNLLDSTIESAEECPGECIFIESE